MITSSTIADKTSVFQEQLLRLRDGDPTAIREFVKSYEPQIRRILRPRIARALLRRAADSVDICQSVLGSFLLRLAAGEYELREENDLRNLLMSIAERKFLALVRRESAAKRDHRRTLSLDQVDEPPERLAKNPVHRVDQWDLVEELTRRLAPEELELYHWKRQGRSWEELAERTGVAATLLRKRFSRGVNRVVSQLGLEDAEE